MKGLSILGSTGSVGKKTLEIVAQFPERFRVVALAAGGNIDLLAEQIRTFRPKIVSVSTETYRQRLKELLVHPTSPVELLCGDEGNHAVALFDEASLVVNAMVGSRGLLPTLFALKRGANVAIANKEPVVMAGHLCVEEARKSGATILPVDSEHSAIFQTLRAHKKEDIHQIWITGSGGPFRTTDDLSQVTLEQALSHPTWSMGQKVTIDSATLMNKGLEVIEARWLFDLEAERIHILIHPESIIHALVDLVDGGTVAHLGLPDMRLPIAYALGFPQRLPLNQKRLDLIELARLSFEAPDLHRFPCLSLAYQAINEGGPYPAVLNAANEVAVEAFLQGKIHFTDIAKLISMVLQSPCPTAADHLEAILEADIWAQTLAREAVAKLS